MSIMKKLSFYQRRQQKIADKKAREEQKRREELRKKEIEKKKKKKSLIGLVIFLAILYCFVGIMALTSDEEDTKTKKMVTVSKTENSTDTEKNSEPLLEEIQQEPEIFEEEIESEKDRSSANNMLDAIPEYNGMPYAIINNNVPFFEDSELTTASHETYSDLDQLGRCGVAYASVGQDIMPTEERGAIGSVKPTGWHTVKYDCVDGKYLYNRCHLIGYQLTGENANVKNLITGTRYMNVDGMLPFENMVADYVKATDNHVQYRVTPIYQESNLLVSGVLLEAKSVEDNGEGILFNVYCYNVQPGVVIDYSNGDSYLDESSTEAITRNDLVREEQSTENYQTNETQQTATYILNNNTMKFHTPSCRSVSQMKDSNKQEYTGMRADLINQGYEPCQNCNP